jgi:hypothetical protein
LPKLNSWLGISTLGPAKAVTANINKRPAAKAGRAGKFPELFLNEDINIPSYCN